MATAVNHSEQSKMAAPTLADGILAKNSESEGLVAAIHLYLINLESESEEDDFVRDMILRKCVNQWRRKRTLDYRPVRPRLGLGPVSSQAIGQSLPQVPVPRFSAGEFKRHLGMSKTTFESLSLELGPLLRRRPQGMSLEKQLTIGLWLFANNESFGSVCDRFAISAVTCWSVLKWTMDALHRMDERRGCIQWPRGPRAAAIAEHFRGQHGFPGVVGCLGARRVLLLQSPTATAPNQVSTTGSLVLQAVCDDRASFVDVHVTRVDTTASKSSVFRHSPLAKRLTNDQDFPINGNGHLLAESSYALHKHLLTPYQVELPSQVQRCYDVAHAKCRSSVDRAFARLLCRFRGLAPVDVPRPHLAPDFVSACCVLHNFCIARGDRMSREEVAAEARVGDGEDCHRVLRNRVEGEDSLVLTPRGLETIKRDSIANVLFVVGGQKTSSV